MLSEFRETLGPAKYFNRRIVLVAGPNVMRADILAHLQVSSILHPICLPPSLLEGLGHFKDAIQQQRSTKENRRSNAPNRSADQVMQLGVDVTTADIMEAEVLDMVHRFAFGNNLSKPSASTSNSADTKENANIAIHFDPAFSIPETDIDTASDNQANERLKPIHDIMEYWPDAELVVLTSINIAAPAGAEHVSSLLSRYAPRARSHIFVATSLDVKAFEALVLSGETQ